MDIGTLKGLTLKSSKSDGTIDIETRFLGTGLIPYRSLANNLAPYVCYASLYKWKQTNRVGQEKLVIIAYSNLDGFMAWCSDDLLEEKLTADEMADLQTKAFDVIKDASAKVKAKAHLKGLIGIQKSTGRKCPGFDKLIETNTCCLHIKSVLDVIKSEELEELKSRFENVIAGVKATAEDSLVKYFRQLAFKTPVLIEGERGSGKTYGARHFAISKSIDLIEVDGHEGVESHDLLGFFVPDGEGGLIWKDGGLTEAFRRARTGKVVLLVDEILRIPQRPLSVFLSALSPFKGHYKLRTGRMVATEDEVGVEESIEVPCENLFVVATTNVGSQYAVDSIDPALAERFVVLRKDTDVETLEKVLGGVASKKGFSSKLVAKLVSFWSKMEELKRQGMINQAPTVRTLARALDIADSEAEIKETLNYQVLLWVARDIDGFPVREQVEITTGLISKLF